MADLQDILKFYDKCNALKIEYMQTKPFFIVKWGIS